jgi:hypothetical protein
MNKRLLISLSLLAVLLTFAGCQRALNHSETVTVPSLGYKEIEFAPARSHRKVKVTFRSETPVSGYLALETNIARLRDRLDKQQRVTFDDAMVQKEKVTEDTLETTIAAKHAFFVVIANSGSKDAAVQLHVTSDQ